MEHLEIVGNFERTEERLRRLEKTVGTLVSWLTYHGLRPDESQLLFKILAGEDAK